MQPAVPSVPPMSSASLAADRAAIVALVHAYPRLQDGADFEGIGRLFA